MKLSHYGNGLLKGMAVTIKQNLRHPTVTQYPEQRLHTSRRIRGQELIWDQKRCTGCATCAKTCHQGAIKIVTSTDAENNRYIVETYRVDTGYCIQCGLCVEACPYDALFMGAAYERARYRRHELVQEKEQMLDTPDRAVSGYYHPERAEKLPKQTLLLEKIVEDT